ncbi:MAG: AGE family epimerase/isomerase [Vallitaleaceae bacterium]|nr:AGE family epimerase/isomerase [Vallitaleaceae bacterium]
MWNEEIKEHLENRIIPFWSNLQDREFGGYYGFMDTNLVLDKKAIKGCILNSRILWFFSNAYVLLQDKSLLEQANHAYEFLKSHCIDPEFAGVFWSLNYDGSIHEDIKHTYNQAFAIYALSSYYEASGDKSALELAFQLYEVIESKCKDEVGYLEAFSRNFEPIENDKLSENGIIAEKTMNTLLHVFEAYTELYRISKEEKVAKNLEFMLDLFMNKVYNPTLERQEVFFDAQMNSLIDLHSYGHDIETAWLIDRGCEVLGKEKYRNQAEKITKALTKKIYERAYVKHSLLNECEKGKDDTKRVWWVQAEAVVGFLNGFEKDRTKTEYFEAAKEIWTFIKEKQVDSREGSEWFSEVDENGVADQNKPIVEPWKCPYHNGRMCIEVIRRMENVASTV